VTQDRIRPTIPIETVQSGRFARGPAAENCGELSSPEISVAAKALSF